MIKTSGQKQVNGQNNGDPIDNYGRKRIPLPAEQNEKVHCYNGNSDGYLDNPGNRDSYKQIDNPITHKNETSQKGNGQGNTVGHVIEKRSRHWRLFWIGNSLVHILIITHEGTVLQSCIFYLVLYAKVRIRFKRDSPDPALISRSGS